MDWRAIGVTATHEVSGEAKDPRPDVLFVATDLSTGGGVNKVIRDLAELFTTRLGRRVTVVNARSDREPSYAFPPNVLVEQHRRQSLPAYFWLLLRLRWRRPRVVIGPWAQDNILIALAFLFSRTKVVLVEHAPWHFHTRLVQLLRRIIYPLADVVVVLNRNDLAHFRQYLRGVRLIPDPVAGPSKVTREREKLVLAVGHLSPLKNFADAIRAFARSRLEEDGWSLAIIGSGSEEEKLRALIRDFGLARAFIHTGKEDLGGWYARASILLVTSRLESFSLVLAEAMLAGVVPVAYATDGPSFILEDFPDQLVKLGDVESLAERLRTVATQAESEPLREKLSQSTQSRFAPEVIAEEWSDLLA